MGQVTDIDGNTYKTIKIGDQWWMAENLKVTYYRNGDNIPNVTDSSEWQSLSTGAYCTYGNENATTYGLLYNWHAINDSSNIAPLGWHVPTEGDWTTLTNYLIANGYNWDGSIAGNKIGKAMASNSGWNNSNQTGDVGNDMDTNNSSGFESLPGGFRNSVIRGRFFGMGEYCVWWSYTPYDSYHAWSHMLMFGTEHFSNPVHPKEFGFSVRLIRD